MHLSTSRCRILTLWTTCLLAGSTGVHAEDYGTHHPDAPAELLQFAFLIGPWDCEVDWPNPDGSRSQGKATWTGRWMMDGWAIQDDFRGGFYDGYLATTFRAWDKQEKGWRGYWLDGPSGRWSRPLVQEAVDQGLRFRTSMEAGKADGKAVEIEMRYHFHRIGDRDFSWRQDTSLDGEIWQEGRTKIECARPASWAEEAESPPRAAPARGDGDGAAAGG